MSKNPRPEKDSVKNPNELIVSISDLCEDETLKLVEKRLNSGDDPLSIVEECQEGMRQVGKRFEEETYYLAGLIMAGEIFRKVMELTQPFIEKKITGKNSGKVLLGTVAGDIHDIGKNIQSMLLSCHGFTVIDLGVDIQPGEFLNNALKIKPDIVGLSGLLTITYSAMKETVEVIRQLNDKIVNEIPIIIGGGNLNEQILKYTGADYFITNAMKGVRLCKQIVKGDSSKR